MEANLKLFEDLDGLKTIVGCLNFGYREIKDLQRFKELIREKAYKDREIFEGEENSHVDYIDESNESDIDFNKEEIHNLRKDPKFSSVPNPNRNNLQIDS